MRHDGKSVSLENATKRGGHSIIPTSSKSPVASGSTFESVEDSDDEDMNDIAELETSYLQANGDVSLPDHINGSRDQISIVASSTIRSHSVSGDLHGVQPGPIAADILRKDPEYESFTLLRISPIEVPPPDELEAYWILKDCLELWKKYLFSEAVAPWEKEIVSDSSTPKPNPDPFVHTPEAKFDHYFEMVDGVVHVYANKDGNN